MDLSTTLCRVKLQNPTILASGILDVSGASMANVVRNGGAGAVTTKSASREERTGHPCPVIIMYEQGMLNAVGLSSPGMREAIGEIEHYRRSCNAPLIASVFSLTEKGFGEAAKEISKARPDCIEANLSCPNIDKERGKEHKKGLKGIQGKQESPEFNARLSADIIRRMKKKTGIPVIAKLSPNTPDIKAMAAAVQKAGADAINMGNTAGPGMVINIETGKPILANKAGGVSGPGMLPLAVRCVYDVYEATDGRLPIIGTGGVTYGKDAVQMIMAGASAVGIGTGIYYRGIDVFRKVCEEMREIMEKNGYRNIREMRGIAHK